MLLAKVIPRGVLDIRASMLLRALGRTGLSSTKMDELVRRVQTAWDVERPSLVSLSVRSGFDALLTALAWPAGSEVLLSAVTIPDMARIIEAHGLVPVPVDVNSQTLAPAIDQLSSRFTARTRAILVAHLFGSRLDLREVVYFAQSNGIALWEDMAQGFAGDDFRGDPVADVSFFSFGLIKAQTACGGGVLRFRDQALAEECRCVQSRWPTQSSHAYRKRLARAVVLQTFTQRPFFTALAHAATACGLDLDERLSSLVRGFASTEFFAQLRQQPCRGLLGLLHRRLTRPDRRWLDRKTSIAARYRQLLPLRLLLGQEATFPTHWVMPIRSRDPQGLRQRLWHVGYDATTRGSQLRVIAPPATQPEWTTPLAAEWVPQLIYLPLHPALRSRHVEEIARLVREFEADAHEPRAVSSTSTTSGK